jgi:hypothetical protein
LALLPWLVQVELAGEYAKGMVYFRAGLQTEDAATRGCASSTPALVLELCVLVLDFMFGGHPVVVPLDETGLGAPGLVLVCRGYKRAMASVVKSSCKTLQDAAQQMGAPAGILGELLLLQGSLLRWLADMEQLDPATATGLLQTARCVVSAVGSAEGRLLHPPTAPFDQDLISQVRSLVWQVSNRMVAAASVAPRQGAAHMFGVLVARLHGGRCH